MSRDIKVIDGGIVAADALLEFDAAVSEPNTILIMVPLSDSIVVYRKMITKLSREEYQLDEEVYVADGRVVLARELAQRGDFHLGSWWELQRSILRRINALTDRRTLQRIDAYVEMQVNFLTNREAAEVSMSMAWNELLSRLSGGQSRNEVHQYVQIGLRDDWFHLLSKFVDYARSGS